MEAIETITMFDVAVAVTIAALLGFVGHIVRGVFNLFPDKISDSAIINIAVSDGYDLKDYLFGVEFDNYGYYELYSLKNMRLAIMHSAFAGFVIMCFVPEQAFAIVQLMDLGAAWAKDYLAQQFAQIGARYF